MKQRTEKEGRRLVDAYKASGKSRQRYAEDAGVSFSALQYWIRRIRKLDSSAVVANRFVEVEVPQGDGEAMRVDWGEVRISFSRLPDTQWLSVFLDLFSA